MRVQSHHVILAIFVVTVCVAAIKSIGKVNADDPAGYVLALSWSPTHCTTARSPDPLQCRPGRQQNRFIMHGLWPSFENDRKEYCNTLFSEKISDGLVAQNLDLTPSSRLLRHLWRKHGSCTGLSAQDYFYQARTAYNKVHIPANLLPTPGERKPIDTDELEASIAKHNPGLNKRGIGILCEGPYLSEIRICMSPSLDFTNCPAGRVQRCQNNEAIWLGTK